MRRELSPALFPSWQATCNAFGAAIAGGPGIVVLVGPAGSGKTFTLLAFAAGAAGVKVCLRNAAQPMGADTQVDIVDNVDVNALAQLTPFWGTRVLAVRPPAAPQVLDAFPGARVVTMQAMTPRDVRAMVEVRHPQLQLPIGFSSHALSRLTEFASGNPRRLDDLLFQSLRLAHAGSSARVAPGHVELAACQLLGESGHEATLAFAGGEMIQDVLGRIHRGAAVPGRPVRVMRAVGAAPPQRTGGRVERRAEPSGFAVAHGMPRPARAVIVGARAMTRGAPVIDPARLDGRAPRRIGHYAVASAALAAVIFSASEMPATWLWTRDAVPGPRQERPALAMAGQGAPARPRMEAAGSQAPAPEPVQPSPVGGAGAAAPVSAAVPAPAPPVPPAPDAAPGTPEMSDGAAAVGDSLAGHSGVNEHPAPAPAPPEAEKQALGAVAARQGNAAEAARLLSLGKALFAIDQAADAADLLQASAAMGNAEAAYLLAALQAGHTRRHAAGSGAAPRGKPVQSRTAAGTTH